MGQIELKNFTVYIFSARFSEAEDIARSRLNNQQPWTWIADSLMLDNLTHIHLIKLYSSKTHPDAENIAERLKQIQVEPLTLI